MIYDPRRRALKLKQRIFESMTAEEMEEYVRLHPLGPEPAIESPEHNGGGVSAPTDQ